MQQNDLIAANELGAGTLMEALGIRFEAI